MSNVMLVPYCADDFVSIPVEGMMEYKQSSSYNTNTSRKPGVNRTLLYHDEISVNVAFVY